MIILAIVVVSPLIAQENKELPYYEIPEYPEEFTAGTMAARMIDALGFRYYWASDSLTEKDLAYRANEPRRPKARVTVGAFELRDVYYKKLSI